MSDKSGATANQNFVTHAEAAEYLKLGVFSINEVRKSMGFAPIDGGDVHCILTDVAVIPVTDLTLYATPLHHDDDGDTDD